MSNNFEFNPEQKEAIRMAVDWYRRYQDGKTRKPYFALAGFAGTGKTSVAKEIATQCVGEYGALAIAPTGKAAARLKQKGFPGAKTLHQFIYNVRGEDEEGNPMFFRKDTLLEKPQMVVLDEGSMVGEWDAERLLSHRIPVLVLLDTGQIPPVKAAPYFIHPDTELQQIMRQSKESNIIRASFFVRQGNRLPVREYDDVVVSDAKPRSTFLKAHMGPDSQVICSFNTTRVFYNKLMRDVAGHCNPIPSPGEKIVCTFNQHGAGFMNGEQLIVKSYEDVPDMELDEYEMPGMLYVIGTSLTTGKEIKCKLNPDCFIYEDELDQRAAQRNVGGFDYGYCITIHKSQGSEWDNVIVIEEMLRGVPYAKMMYTAVTRAAKRLWVFRS
ncbi:helicase [Pantoea phage Kyle]|uniref:Helicase n=1 Tax=Pantoea phage Kyle TaxID=2589665 RepID=A0A514A8S7_9CAUD|nr:Dda-like helicase [Pantoea phage Kyle]QDH49655.1 helicase [Pantoea phage Kyle]